MTSPRPGGCGGLPNSVMSAPAKKVRPAQAITTASTAPSVARLPQRLGEPGADLVLERVDRRVVDGDDRDLVVQAEVDAGVNAAHDHVHPAFANSHTRASGLTSSPTGALDLKTIDRQAPSQQQVGSTGFWERWRICRGTTTQQKSPSLDARRRHAARGSRCGTALRRHRRAGRRLVRSRRRSDPGANRAERRRQDDPVQLPEPPLHAEPRRHPLRRQLGPPPAAARYRRDRHQPHLSEPGAVRAAVSAGQHPHRRTCPQPRRLRQRYAAPPVGTPAAGGARRGGVVAASKCWSSKTWPRGRSPGCRSAPASGSN